MAVRGWLLAWLWPPPAQAVGGATSILWLGGFFAALSGLVAMLLDAASLRVGVLGIGGLGAALLAAAAALLAQGLDARAEGARRAARLVLPLVVVAAGWAAAELLEHGPTTRSLRKAIGWSALVAALALWTWLTLGRADVRALFGPGRMREALRGVAPILGWGALFLLTTVGAAVAITAGGARVSSKGLRFLALLVGACGSGLVTTLGAYLALRLWRGPEAEVDLVTPEAWTRILALRGERTTAIVAALEREGLPPPGRRWTVDVVREVLRADDPSDGEDTT